MTFPRPLVVLPLLAALLVIPVGIPPSLADGLDCAVCGRSITGRYIEEAGKPYHLECYERYRAPRCGVCGKPILESRITWEGVDYHPDCFREAKQPRCAGCGKPIEGKYFVEGGKSYHPWCHRSNSPKCVVCGEALVGRYLADGWGNPFHERHGQDLICPFCNRVMAPATTRGSFISSANGMRICRICLERAVTHRPQVARIIERVRRRLQDLFPVPAGSFTWQLVDKLELLALHPGGRSPGDELGITLGEKMRSNGKTIRSIRVSLLSGLPDWLLEAVAAHELTHVWQQLHDLNRLSLDEEEGSAELAAYLLLREGGSEEGKVKIRAMKDSNDPAYGIGFRKALRLAGEEARAGERLRQVLVGGKGWPAAP